MRGVEVRFARKVRFDIAVSSERAREETEPRGKRQQQRDYEQNEVRAQVERKRFR